ncbi:MAG: biotin synthase BioB [Deltaproteobacteria bacterium]|nr:biotin synthase BioB [Deltaproteobacteria bacterium]
MVVSRWGVYAERALAGEAPTWEEALAVLRAPDEDLRELLWSAFRVREHHWGRRVKLCMLRNARSGLCPEDCHYCSQSAVSTATIDTYRLLPTEDLVAGARAAAERGARRYCMVTSGRGPSARDIGQLTTATRAIRAEHPDLEICVSLGLLDEDQARELKAAGVGWVNHNLNTSARFHPEVCTTHTYEDRVRTVRAVKHAGLAVCCGGIVGMGERDEDVVDLAFALRELRVDSLPLNFLLSIDGTPLADAGPVAATRALRALALMRFTNPASDIRAAGGRERNLGSWQGLALYPANSVFIEGYLTTPGLGVLPTRRLIEEMGFAVEGEVEVVEDGVEAHV